MAHVAEFCDVWMPIGFAHDIKGGLEVLAKECEKQGRDPKTVDLGVFGAPNEAEALDELAELGVTRATLALPQVGRDPALAKLDEYEKLLKR